MVWAVGKPVKVPAGVGTKCTNCANHTNHEQNKKVNLMASKFEGSAKLGN